MFRHPIQLVRKIQRQVLLSLLLKGHWLELLKLFQGSDCSPFNKKSKLAVKKTVQKWDKKQDFWKKNWTFWELLINFQKVLIDIRHSRSSFWLTNKRFWTIIFLTHKSNWILCKWSKIGKSFREAKKSIEKLRKPNHQTLQTKYQVYCRIPRYSPLTILIGQILARQVVWW